MNITERSNCYSKEMQSKSFCRDEEKEAGGLRKKEGRGREEKNTLVITNVLWRCFLFHTRVKDNMLPKGIRTSEGAPR